MVLFDTNPYFCHPKKESSDMKYSLLQKDMPFAMGKTDLRKSHGSLIDIRGCLGLHVISGYAVVTANFKKQVLRPGDFVLLFYDSTFSIDRMSVLFSVRFVAFAYDLVEEAIYKPLSDDFWEILYENPVFHPTNEQQALLGSWWLQMEWLNRMDDEAGQREMLKNSVRNLLIAIDTEIIRSGGNGLQRNKSNHAWMLITRFFRLVSQHCREIREVQFYAGRLSITTPYLYKLCRKYLKLSPKEILDKQVVTEIKTYLVNTDMPVKRIAHELHFEDVSYMCRYFKRQTGFSPAEYREKLK